MPARDWALIRKNYIQTYNLKVEAYFPDSKDTLTKELYLIKGTDSIPIAQMRIKLFEDLQPQELSEVTIRVFDSCNLLEPVFRYRTIRCIPGTESAIILQHESLADILGNQCHKECYSAVPEMWQVRIEANRPQMVFMFAEFDETGKVIGYAKNPITLPHPIDSQYLKSPLPEYQKGQWEALLTLKDNSKLIINAFNLEEAEKMLEACKKLIKPEMLEGAIERPIAPRKGTELLQIKVRCLKSEYFPNGLKNAKPSAVSIFS